MSSTPIYTLYWLHEPEHTDPLSEGYIGVTFRDPSTRHNEHKAKHTNVTDTSVLTIIADGMVRDTAYELEEQYRPKWYIGWNVSPGGHGGTMKDPNRPPRKIGWKLTEEQRSNISRGSLGNTNGRHKAKPVLINDVEYPDCRAAAKSFGLSYRQVYDRIKNPKYPNYNYK